MPKTPATLVEVNVYDEPLAVVSIGDERLTAAQAELLYRATTSIMGRLGERVSENRYDTEALANLADATRISSLLVRAIPKKPEPKVESREEDDDEG